MNSEWLDCTCKECGFIWTFNYYWEDFSGCPKCTSIEVEYKEDKDEL